MSTVLSSSLYGGVGATGSRFGSAATKNIFSFESTLRSALSNDGDGGLVGASSLAGSSAGTGGQGSHIIRASEINSVTYGEVRYYGTYGSSSSHSTDYSFRETDDASDTPLPDVKSYYTGDKFSIESLSVGTEEVVGDNIYEFHNAHFVEKDGTIYAYFIDHSGNSKNDVGLATSTDGVNFDYQGKVLTKGEEYDANKAGFPCVQYDESSGQWTMLYEATSAEGDIDTVCMATSADGLNWTKQGPIIEPGDAGWISEVDVGTPTFFQEDGVYHVYFHTFTTDGRVRIGYATGTDLQDLTVQQGALLDVDATGSESVTVGSRSQVFQHDGYYYMAYEVSSGETYDFDTHTWGINLARSTSPGGPWEKMDGPLISSDEAGFGTDGPEILERDGQLYVYFRNDYNGTSRVAVTGI